jgi:hypothetical protein
MNLCNCKECGKLFVKSTEGICPACFRQREIELENIREWITLKAQPRLVNIEKETGVSEKTFRKYLLDGRIRAFSKVLAPCDVCKKETYLKTKNVVCEDCKTSLKTAQSFKSPRELENTELYSRLKPPARD